MTSAVSRVVLVVEDEWLLRQMLAGHLREAGYDVRESATAEGALALLKNGQQIDLLITDISLSSSLSGWDVAEAFRNARPEIPVIYVSGNSLDPRRQVSDSVFISKPYKPDAVLEICRELR